MAQQELQYISVFDQHHFEKAHHKKPSELTLDDCMVLARCGQALKDDPYLESWTYGGETFDLNVWAEYDDEEGNTPPEHIKLAVFGLDSEGETDYSKPIHQWTVDYQKTEEWR